MRISEHLKQFPNHPYNRAIRDSCHFECVKKDCSKCELFITILDDVQPYTEDTLSEALRAYEQPA